MTSDECEGRIFRVSVGFFTTKEGGYSKRINLNNLKRKSCGTCNKCTWLDECEVDSIKGINDVIHQKMYKIEMTNISHDYESGLVDDFDLILIEHIEKEKRE